MERKKICFVNAISLTAICFLKPHFINLSQFCEVHYVSADVNEGHDDRFPTCVCHHVTIERPIALEADCKAVYTLYRLFCKERFAVVHSITPKAGLITALAARLAGIPIRIHTFTGQVWAARKGLMRFLLRTMDKVIAHLDTRLYTDSESQRQYLISEGIIPKDRSAVLANGSLLGADINRFCPDTAVRKRMRRELGISDPCFVFAFLGRLNKDKGIRELLAAFDRLSAENVTSARKPYLLLVGSDEENMKQYFSQHAHIKAGDNFCAYGSTPRPEHLMQAADVFVLPTYREGFPQSPLEMAALSLPVIISDIYGTQASIVNHVTGLRCQPADVDSLYEAMRTLFDHPDKAVEMGAKGRQYVAEQYEQKILEKVWIDLYKQLLFI